MIEKQYKTYINKIIQNLGVLDSFLLQSKLCIQKEPQTLAFVETDYLGRFQRMEEYAAISWKKMKAAAQKDGITLNIVSAFRSVQEQLSIIQRKLENGLTEDFDQSAAFHWLQENAKTYHFKLSFPKDNAFGMAYEPWHWKYVGHNVNHDLIVILKKLEESLWITKTRFDKTYMESILATDFLEFGRSGTIYQHQDIINTSYQEINAALPLKNFKVRLINNNIVQTTYISAVNIDNQILTSNRSSIWIKASGQWKLYFHQGTPLNT